jgi:hypothetical protein
VESLVAELDGGGPHRVIKHQDMRVFWRAFFQGDWRVSWQLWCVQKGGV